MNIPMSKAAKHGTEPRDNSAEDERVRLDKFLWAARFFKTRALAAEAIEGGRVRLDGERVKLSHAVRTGERYTVTREGLHWTFSVKAVSDKRGNAAAAALLFDESAESVKAREDELAIRKAAFSAGATFNHRPTKRDRRDLIKYFERRDDDENTS
jgi:ribosome-associated heat shock protein Hsp15